MTTPKVNRKQVKKMLYAILDRFDYLHTKVGASSIISGVPVRDLCKAYRLVLKDLDQTVADISNPEQVKAWAMIDTDISGGLMDVNISKAYIKDECRNAKELGFHSYKVIPCTITYSLPKKKK